MGDWKGCIETLEKDATIPEDSDDFFLAMAYWQLGDKAKARAVFDRADRWLAKS